MNRHPKETDEQYARRIARQRGWRIYNKIPSGWRIMQGVRTNPRGLVTIYNGKSRFAHDSKGKRLFKQAFLKKQW